MERDFNALMHTLLTTLQTVTEQHGEDRVARSPAPNTTTSTETRLTRA